MTNKVSMYQRLCRVQGNLMGMDIPSVKLEDLLPLIFKECLKENLMFYFNFIENACVLNLRDITCENLELNIRLYYPNEEKDISIIGLKEQILLNAFLLTKKSTTINASSAKESSKKEEEEVPPIKESNLVPPTAIRAVIEILEKAGEPVTRKNIEKNLQLNKMSIDNRRRCIAYLRSMEE